MNNPIHLAIDAVGAKHGGAATVLIDLLNAVIEDVRVTKITLFCSPSKRRLFKMPSSDKLIEAPKPWVDRNYALRILWYEWLLGLECRRIRADVLLVSANFGRAGFGVPHVTFIQQSLPFSKEAVASFSSLPMTIKIGFIGWQMKRSCQKAARVVCQSSVMKDWITDTFRLDPARVVPVYSEPRQLSKLNSPKSFPETDGHLGSLLYVGNDAPYKMLKTLVEGIELIRRSFSRAELIMTLPSNHHYSSQLGVECVGYLSDERLAQAYLNADVLVLPSLVETVGMPTLEAMSLGTPVLVADRPYAHDICEDAALFFDPNSPKDFAEKAIRVLTDNTLRQTLITKGLKLVEKRRAEQPYKKIIDIVVKCAYAHKTKAS